MPLDGELETFFTVVKYVKPGLDFLSTTAATLVLLLGTKPRVPLESKDVEPGPVKISPVSEGKWRTAGYQASHVLRRILQGEARGNYSLVALIEKWAPGIPLSSYFPKPADCLDWANGDVIDDNSQIFVAGYINPHSQSFGRLAS